MSVQKFERQLTNARGEVVRVVVSIDTGDVLEKEIVALANRANRTPKRKATAAGGVVTVEIISQKDEARAS
jgi:hypothetical protein